jgi:hypothetical protein
MISELRPIGDDTSEMKYDDTPLAWARIAFDNGTTAHVARTGVGREAELVCADGTIRVFNDGDAIQVRRRTPVSDALDVVDVAPLESWSGTVRMIQDLVHMIQTGKPGRSNLEVTMLSQEIGFGLYESHLQGGVAVSPPIPRRGLWVSSW